MHCGFGQLGDSLTDLLVTPEAAWGEKPQDSHQTPFLGYWFLAWS